jgi:SAM-dependent methyltransferase
MEQLKLDGIPLYRDGRHYDRIVAKGDDIPFYLAQARAAEGPVLELGCGTGRLTIPLAKAGIPMTGLDISEPMLQEARAKAAAAGVDVTWVEADCREFSLGKKFKLILFPYHSIQHLHEMESLEALFKCVKKHLDKGGVFFVNAFNPSLKLLTRDTSRRYPVARYLDPSGSGEVIIEENNVYDDERQLNKITWYSTIGPRRVQRTDELLLRCFFPQEFDALLQYNGFKILKKHGNFDGKAFGSCDPEQIVVCAV